MYESCEGEEAPMTDIGSIRICAIDKEGRNALGHMVGKPVAWYIETARPDNQGHYWYTTVIFPDQWKPALIQCLFENAFDSLEESMVA